MSNKINYFPLGIAKGEAFCNRFDERTHLMSNLNNNRHTIVISPRRYGKSSLVLYTLNEADLPFERVDLFVAVNLKTVEEQIVKGVKNLIGRITKTPEQVVGFIKDFVKKLKIRWIIGTDGANIELIPEQNGDSVIIIMEALQMLENVLCKKNIQAAFFIDEFQEIGVIANNSGLEGAIRYVAQESKNLRFIFSGSNRHILANMFDNRSSPLYMLCDRITIDRIAKQHYVKFLNKIAIKTWDKELEQVVIDEIFKITERHPYYFNVLCDKIWAYSGNQLPTAKLPKILWNSYILQEESRIAKELSSLNLSQKKILIAIAQGYTEDLSGKSMLQKFNITSATVSKSLRYLEEQDYIQRNKDGHALIDPLIRDSLIQFYPHMF